ncbi:hypothetical protein JCM10212_002353 [Sporobolomyces blumeae]
MPTNSLARDLPLYLLLTSAFTVPLVSTVSSPSSATRVQVRALVHAATQAVSIALASVGVVVLGGGALVLGEKAYRFVKAKWHAVTRRAGGQV